MKKDVETVNDKRHIVIGVIFWIAVFLGLFLMFSCGSTRKKTEITDTSKITDTTVYKKTIVPKDSLIKIPGAALKVSVLASQLDDGQPVETKTDRGRVILQKNGENIEAVCVIDDLVKVIQLQNTVIENYEKITSESLKSEKVEKETVPWWASPWLTVFLNAIWLIMIATTWLTNRKKT